MRLLLLRETFEVTEREDLWDLVSESCSKFLGASVSYFLFRGFDILESNALRFWKPYWIEPIMSFNGLGFGFSLLSSQSDGLINPEPSPSRFLDLKVLVSWGLDPLGVVTLP